MRVVKKPDIITSGTPPSVSRRLPAPYEIGLASYSVCPWGLPYQKILYINGTAWTDAAFGTWMVWDSDT